MKKLSKFKTEIFLTIIFAVILICSSSCKNLVPYTDALQTQRKWKTEELKNAQFYLSEDITLERTLTKEFPDAIIGKIVMKDGIRKEQVLLPKHLPVVFIDTVDIGAYSIQCDNGNNKLTFGTNPNQDGQYVLLATEWKDGYGKVHYNGVEYFVSTEQAKTHLLIDLRKQKDESNKFHIAKGVKVNHHKK